MCSTRHNRYKIYETVPDNFVSVIHTYYTCSGRVSALNTRRFVITHVFIEETRPIHMYYVHKKLCVAAP